MSSVEVLPELKQIIGAMLFAAKEPVTLTQIRKTFSGVAESRGGAAKDFASATEKDIKLVLDDLKESLEKACCGIRLVEVARGYRLENDSGCGPWLREMLNRGKPNRLSKPALETLAIIAYRQPCTRAEIESVRGVAVDQMVRNLLDVQLIRAVGRSDLPGRPWLFGTTQTFLTHFGLKDLDDLPGVEELRRINEAQKARKAEVSDEPGGEQGTEEDSPGEDEQKQAAPVLPADEAEEVFEDDEDEFEDDDDDDDEE